VITSQLFNTGVDSTGTALVGSGVEDPHYVVVESMSQAKTVTPHSAWYANDADSNWVWQNADGGPTGVTRTFSTSFDLTGYDPASAKITGSWGVDNSGIAIFINDARTGIVRKGNGFGVLTPFTIDSGFLAGQNKLRFVVEDTGVIAGLRVDDIELTAIPNRR
jgi:hypothetical protein